MSSTVEGESVEIEPEELPASIEHRFPREEQELEKIRFSKESVIEFVRKVEERPIYYATHFELDLEEAGLISALEDSGVLPVLEQSLEITSESDANAQKLNERAKSLKDIYIGTILGHLFDELEKLDPF
jgi:hypothetical protein